MHSQLDNTPQMTHLSLVQSTVERFIFNHSLTLQALDAAEIKRCLPLYTDAVNASVLAASGKQEDRFEAQLYWKKANQSSGSGIKGTIDGVLTMVIMCITSFRK